jgi:phosphoribosylanthranilate isomerase
VEWFEGVESSKLIIAGGLTPENLPEVLKLNPYGVDVSSGVERAPGRKDPKKVVEFLKIAKGG